MEVLNHIVLIGAVLLFASILASAASARLGAPLLLVFLVLGMLAGEEGIGGIRFDNVGLAYVIGTVSLAVILLDGGMRTRAETFRVGLYPAVSLATLGVVLTGAIVGLFAAWLLDLNWMQGLLLGAIVGSTDAAAVFSLLHARGMNLKQRVGSTLEIESGSNDPMAVFLTVLLIEALAQKGTLMDWWLVLHFLQQLGVGALTGYLGGHALVWLVNRLTLATGLYPLLVTSGGLLLYALANAAGGSGFLAIYLVGLVLGNSRLRSVQNILRVHDGLAWLAQIGMFLILGLLVTPSELLASAPAAVLIAAVLMFVARPLAVAVSLLPFRFAWREQVYIGWVGLRGAVPIILALFPLLAGLEAAPVYFNVAFFVVLVSLLLQGWTLAPAARWLQLEVPPSPDPVLRLETFVPGHPEYEVVVYPVVAHSRVRERSPSELTLPPACRITAVVRAGAVRAPEESGVLCHGDYVHVLAPSDDVVRLSQVFSESAYASEHQFFGDFLLDADAKLADVALMYGFDAAEHAQRTVAEYVDEAFHKRPVVGDRVRFDRVELVVREMEQERIRRVGVKFLPPEAGADPG